MMWRAVLPWAAFQVVWFSCAVGAAMGRSAPGIVAALLFSGLMIRWAAQPRRAAVLVAQSGLCGFLIESGLIHAGVIRFAAPWPVETLAPVWIVALWMAFGATLPSVADVVGTHRLKVAAGLGALAGPLSYLAGERLGALQFVGSVTWSLGLLALVWAAVMVGLLALHMRDGR